MNVLLVTIKEIKDNSIISGNTDPDKMIQFAKAAQDIHIQNYLGGKLYNKLQQLVLSGDIDDAANVNYKNLLDNYVKKMLIWFAQADYIPFSAFNISNGGVFKHRSENSDTATMDEINDLAARAMQKAEFYSTRFMRHMDYYSYLYPEYVTSTNEEMYPDKDVNFGGLYLG